MTKRKRASKPDPDESTDDTAAKDDMVHVTPDLLAGSPDIFAGKKVEADEATVEEPEPEESPVEPTEAGTTLTPTEDTSAETPAATEEERPYEVTAEPVSAPPPYLRPSAEPARQRGGSGTAIGIVLVVIGIFALVVVMTGVAELCTRSFFPMLRVFSTAISVFSIPSFSPMLRSSAACETNTSELAVNALPNAPNIGR